MASREIEELYNELKPKVHLPPVKPRRWWQFWLQPAPKHYVLDAQTGKYFDVARPQSAGSALFDRFFRR